MNKDIILNARYGYKHVLKYLKDNLWLINFDPKSSGTYRLIGFDGENKIGPRVFALDPDGGPFMSIGSRIFNYRIKTIYRGGIFELEPYEES